MFIKRIKGGIIQINDKTFKGSTMVIQNNQVIIDGIVVDDPIFESRTINIQINGDVGEIYTEAADVTVSGSVTGDVETASGKISCGDVQGDATTMSGDIKCGVVHGDVSTMSGDIRRR